MQNFYIRRILQTLVQAKDTGVDPADVQIFSAFEGVTGIDPGEVIRALTQPHFENIAASLDA